MQNFVAHRSGFIGTTVTLAGEEYFHATRSCRVRHGEIIGLTDGCGRRVLARIVGIDAEKLTAEIERDVSGENEPPLEITVALALIKPSRFETAVEKCTELGARRIIPLITARTTVKPKRLNIERLERIAREAAKQSGRSWIPSIHEPLHLFEVFGESPGVVLLASRDTGGEIEDALKHVPDPGAVTVVVGPEGDFTEEEREVMISGGAVPVSLGGLTLRSETAAIAATAFCAASGVK